MITWVRGVVVTGNVNTTTGGEITKEGVSFVAGDLALLTLQSSSADNGVYSVKAGAWRKTSAPLLAVQTDTPGDNGNSMWAQFTTNTYTRVS